MRLDRSRQSAGRQEPALPRVTQHRLEPGGFRPDHLAAEWRDPIIAALIAVTFEGSNNGAPGWRRTCVESGIWLVRHKQHSDVKSMPHKDVLHEALAFGIDRHVCRLVTVSRA
jgi:hypothetical protein